MKDIKFVNCELPLNTWIMLLEDKGLGDYLTMGMTGKKFIKGKPISRIGYITIDHLKTSPLERKDFIKDFREKYNLVGKTKKKERIICK